MNKSQGFYSYKPKSELARPAGLEPATYGLEVRRSIQLRLRAP